MIQPADYCYQCGQSRDDMGPAFGAWHADGHHRAPQPEELTDAVKRELRVEGRGAIYDVLGFDSPEALVRRLYMDGFRAGQRAATPRYW